MNIVYRIYQLLIAAPLLAVATILTSLVTSIGCTIGHANFWGYYPGKYWSIIACRLLLIPVRVEGREHLDRKTSYVFVANHQGAMDIFLIYGFLCRNFKWMMKKSLRKAPFIGFACQRAHHVFVDRSSPRGVKETILEASHILQGGTSLVVFPEGSRTFTGHMGAFRKGAFLLADELQLPVVPLTIDGSFSILPRTKGINFVSRHPLRLIIHAPIFPEGTGRTDIKALSQKSYDIIMRDLPEKYRD